MNQKVNPINAAQASDNTRWRQPMRLILAAADENVDDDDMDGEFGYAMKKADFDTALESFKEQGYKTRKTGGTIFIADKKKPTEGIYADTVGSKGKVHLNWSDAPDMGEDHFDSESSSIPAKYQWADGMIEVVKKNVPNAKVNDLFDNDGIELVGPNTADGKKIATKVANALKAAGFEVKHGTDEFENEIFAINAKGDSHHMVISETAETFEDGSWIIMLYGTEKIQWSSHSSSAAPQVKLHDFVVTAAKAPTKKQVAHAKKVMKTLEAGKKTKLRAAVSERLDALKVAKSKQDETVKIAQAHLDEVADALNDFDKHVQKERAKLEASMNKAEDALGAANDKRAKALAPLAKKVADADAAYAEANGKSALSPKSKSSIESLLETKSEKLTSGGDKKRKFLVKVPSSLKGRERKVFIEKMKAKGYTKMDANGNLIKPRSK